MKKHLTYHKQKISMVNLHFENLSEFTTLFREKNKEVSDAIRIGVENAMMKRKKTAELFQLTFADADDAEGLAGLNQLCSQVEPDIVVVTGLVPCERRHAYWRLHEPCEGLSAWTAVQKTIANKFKTDKTISNPSRIMRVPGTISFPPERKQARGYVTEIVTLREAW